MRFICAAFVVLSASLFGARTASAQSCSQGYSYSYSSRGFSGSSSYSGPVNTGRWEYVPGGITEDGYRREPCVVLRADPYASTGYVRSSESWSRSGYSRSYTYTDSNGTYSRQESSYRSSYSYSERYTPRR